MYYMNQDFNRPRNVAIYARVSTEHEAQLNALENQKDWYKPILDYNKNWNVVNTYVDEGITGTSAKKRPQFLKMISDAETGVFDLIVTREVSRFARNTVDTLQYTRQLKGMGVEVYFISDNIKTFDGDGELRLTIMATLAQDESRKTSIRVKAGQQTSMEKGVLYGNGNILGYDRVGKELVINQEQAQTVRQIYDWYLQGWGIRKICYQLEMGGFKTAMGKSKWYSTNVSKILKNSFYCGIITYHKQFTPDFLEQKKINNFGEIDLLQVKGTHETIVTEEEYNTVQKLLSQNVRKTNLKDTVDKHSVGQKKPSDVWVKLLECECGHKFNRKKWHIKSNGELQYGYMCYKQIRTGTIRTRLNKGLSIEGICKTPMISDWKLQMMADYLFKQFVSEREQVKNVVLELLETAKSITAEPNRFVVDIDSKKAELQKLENRIDNLLEMRADGEISKEKFAALKQKAEERIAFLKSQIFSETEADDSIDLEQEYISNISAINEILDRMLNLNNSNHVSQAVIDAFVEKIVAREGGFDWYLKNNPNEPIRKVNIDGKRSNKAKVSIEGVCPETPSFVNSGTGCYRE